MAKKSTENVINLDNILFNCRDILRAARNSGSFFEKRDMMLTLIFLRFIGEKYEDGVAYEVPELYRSVGIAEIESKNWTLTPSKYIEFIDHDIDIDYPAEMARIQNEMKQIMAAEKQSQKMLEEAFRGIGYGIE